MINNPPGPAEKLMHRLANEPKMPPSNEFAEKANKEYGVSPFQTWKEQDIAPSFCDLSKDGLV